MPMFTSTGWTAKLPAIAGSAVVITVPSRFSMKKVPATRKATPQPIWRETSGATVAVKSEFLGGRRLVLDGEGGDAAERQLVALHAAADDDAVGAERDEGVVAEGLALVDVRDMHLDHGAFEGVERVQDRDRGMGEGAGIDDDAGGGVA